MDNKMIINRNNLQLLKSLRSSGSELLAGESSLENLAVDFDDFEDLEYTPSEELLSSLKKTVTLFSTNSISNEEDLNRNANALVKELFEKSLSSEKPRLPAILFNELEKVKVSARFEQIRGAEAFGISVKFRHSYLENEDDFIPDAFYRRTDINHSFKDTRTSHDWAELLLNEQSPFYDYFSFAEIYSRHEALSALDQFVSTYDESDLESEIRIKLKSLARKLIDCIE